MSSHNIRNKIVLEGAQYVYPFKTAKRVNPEDMGVLKAYYKKPMAKSEVDRLICRLFKRNPYIEGAMHVNIYFYEIGDGVKMNYFSHNFPNYYYKTQKNRDPEIKFNFK